MSGSQDESVKEFCQELQSILDTRPPISKAKMMSITKAALKAIKFYKHIVMNVEKFITKCKPEYKIPGLYVIDSIIRQSRHQYGTEKDVYGSRFAKNILSTLHHVNKCPIDDRSKITRVLNLWEKNIIFPTDLIRQLFEVHQFNVNTDEFATKPPVADDKSTDETPPGGKELDRFRELQETLLRASAKGDPDTTSILTEIQQITNQLLESQKKSTASNNSGDEPSSTTTSIVNPIEPMQSSVANVLDDFDYGSDNDDDEPRRPTMPNLSTSFSTHTLPPPPPMQFLQPPPGLVMKPNHSNTVSFPITDANNMSISMSFDPTHPPPIFFQQPLPTSLSAPPQHQLNYDHTRAMVRQPNDVDLRPEDMESDSTDDHRHHHHARVSPPPSHFQYNRRRSRSPSPSRGSKRARSSPNSSDRRGSATSRLKEVERRERRRKGLPPLKEAHLVVSSRTLWLGHLPKIISEIDLREMLEPHGEISDLNNIPPRGCAFVCFKERSDAFRCLEKMKDFRFHGNQIKIAWAMSKGVKDRFKDYWDAEHGCTYIPYAELKDISSLSALAEGGTIDDESMPPSLKPSVPAPVHQEAPPAVQQQPSQPLIQLQPSYPHHEFQAPQQQHHPQGPTAIQLDPNNRLPPGSTILMAPHHESPIHMGLPVQMVPPGAQFIQVQQHPHGQPVQVVQRFTGQMFPNSQIMHQMPYGHMIRNAQPGAMIQLQHHPAEFQEFNPQATFAPSGGLHFLTHANAVPTHHHLVGSATGVPLASTTFAHNVEGPSLIKFHEDPHQRAPPTMPPSHMDERQRRPLSATDESLLRLSTSSTPFQAHPASLGPSLLGRPASPSVVHSHPQQFAGNVMQGQQQQPQSHPPLLPLPVPNDEHHKQSPLPRRTSRFQDRDTPSQPPENNAIYGGYHGGRPNFSDRNNPSAIARGPMRGRGVMVSARGFNSNNSSINIRPEFNDNNSSGFRGRGGFNRGGYGNVVGNISGDFRFSARGNPRVNSSHDSLSSHQSSRSPDHRSFPHRHDPHSDRYPTPSSDEYSHRSLPSEALRQRERSTPESASSYNDAYSNSTKSTFVIDETLSSRSGHNE